MSSAAARIFVVDDEPVIAWTVAAILKSNGFAATSFTNPLEALATARRDPPDLLLSDVMMPQLSGIELAAKIKEACPKCRILLFSGQAATVDFLARGLDKSIRILAKPLHPEDLLTAVRARQTDLA